MPPDLASAGLSATMEDYLEAIYQLQEQHQVARVRDIARQLGVKMPSVSGALKTLKARNLVEHERYGYVTLSPEGRGLAEEVHRRHTAIVELLAHIMKLPPAQAEEEACRLEHALSSETLERLLLLTDFVRGDEEVRQHWLRHLEQAGPVCDELPEAEQPEAAPAGVTLDQVPPGSSGIITRVCGEGPVRRRLLDMGLRPGAEVRVERLAPLGDPIEIVLMDYHLTLRRNEAVSIQVRIIEQPLCRVPAGQRVQVTRIHGGAGRKRHLANEGLEPGVELLVGPRRDRHNDVPVQIGDRQLVVGHHVAHDVTVRLL